MLTNRMFFIWWLAIVVVTVFVLTATYVAADSPSALILRTFSLSGENSFGSWWSSLLLFLAALHALDGYLHNRGVRQFKAIGWLMLGLCCLGLSLDEGGSLHERVGILSAEMGYEWWVLIIPFALVFMVMVSVAITSFLKEGAYLRSALVLLVFALFALVAVQEEFEHKLQWSDSMLGMRALIEEGTEMIAILLMVWLCSKNSGGIFRGDGNIAVGMANEFFRPLTGLFLVLLLPVAYWNAVLPDQDRGHPADWFAAVLFFTAAIALLRAAFEGKPQSLRFYVAALVMIAGSCLTFVARVEYAIDHSTFTLNQQGEGLSVRMILLAGLMIAGLLLIHGQRNSVSAYYAIGVFVLCLCAAVFNNLLLVYAVTILAGLAMYLRTNMVLESRQRIEAAGLSPAMA